MRNFILTAYVMLLVIGSVDAQSRITQVKDINTTGPNGSSEPFWICAGDSVVFFAANDGLSGAELWRSDGTAAGTRLVKDIVPGAHSSAPYKITAAGPDIFFVVGTDFENPVLWRSNGTADGTKPLHAFRSIQGMAALGNVLYFSADDGTAGFEVWKSDGTETGTILVRDISPGEASSNPYGLTAAPPYIYFAANAPGMGFELWKSDGTSNGTVLVKDIRPGADGSNPSQLKFLNGKLFFSANNGTAGAEPWTSNGTGAGTRQIKNLFPGSGSSFPLFFTPYHGAIFFSAIDAAHGRELWQTNGTPESTTLVRDLFPGAKGSDAANLKVANQILFFTAATPALGTELWKTDGTAQGTLLVKDIRTGKPSSKIFSMFSTGSRLLFNERGNLWRSDGSPAGTFRLPGNFQPADPERSVSLSGPAAVMNGRLYFNGHDARTGAELWISNGSQAGTVLVRDIFKGSAGSFPELLTASGNSVVFDAFDGINTRIWRSNGNAASTVPISNRFATQIQDVNGMIFFWAPVDARTFGLWKIEGSTTVLLGDKFFNNSSEMISFGNLLIFSASTSDFGVELWRSDGTIAGTKIIRDIAPGIQPSSPRSLTLHGNAVYFTVNEKQLWVTNGTATGTRMISDQVGSPLNGPMISAGPLLFFASLTVQTGCELWRSNGTAAGTFRITDLRQGQLSSLNSAPMAAVGSTLFFSGDDGVHGTELWKSDGTTAGTTMVKDIMPGSESSNPASITDVQGTIYLTANGSLWKSDGTDAGTVMVHQVKATACTDDDHFAAAAGAIYFLGTDDATGEEMWQSDGTPAGTSIVRDLYPGDAGSAACFFTIAGDMLYFTANNGVTGNELWKLALQP